MLTSYLELGWVIYLFYFQFLKSFTCFPQWLSWFPSSQCVMVLPPRSQEHSLTHFSLLYNHHTIMKWKDILYLWFTLYIFIFTHCIGYFNIFVGHLYFFFWDRFFKLLDNLQLNNASPASSFSTVFLKPSKKRQLFK